MIFEVGSKVRLRASFGNRELPLFDTLDFGRFKPEKFILDE